MNRNTLYFIIGALAVGIAVLGYKFYQDQQDPEGVEISIGRGGITIEEK